MGTHPIFESDFDCLTVSMNRLGAAFRSLTVTPQSNAHLWLQNATQRGRPYKLEHPRNAYYKRGATIMDFEKKRDRGWGYHGTTSLPKVTEIRKRAYLSDQHFMTGMVLKVFTLKPKKPTSGNRKVAKIRLRNGQVRLAYIPYENSTLTDHSTVMVYYHPKEDLVGIRLRVLRGIKDANPRAPAIYWPSFRRTNPALVKYIDEYEPPATPLSLNYDEY